MIFLEKKLTITQGIIITSEYFLAKGTTIRYNMIRRENSITTVEAKQ
jgi:hypothetical protein